MVIDGYDRPGRVVDDPYIGRIFVFDSPQKLWACNTRRWVESTYVVLEDDCERVDAARLGEERRLAEWRASQRVEVAVAVALALLAIAAAVGLTLLLSARWWA